MSDDQRCPCGGIMGGSAPETHEPDCPERERMKNEAMAHWAKEEKAKTRALLEAAEPKPEPIPMLLWCPACHERHVDDEEWAKRSHKVHACQNCGLLWQPALVPTVGVLHLPGTSNQ